MPTDGLREYVLQGLLPDVQRARQAREIHRENATHAEAINAAGVGLFFEAVQELSITQLVLSVARLFDRPHRNYEVRSIPGALSYLDRNSTGLTASRSEAALRTYRRVGVPLTSDSVHSDSELTRMVVEGLRSTLPGDAANAADDLSRSLEAVKQRRDKSLAHNEHIRSGSLTPIMWVQVEELLAYADRFLGAVGMGFLQLAVIDDSGRAIMHGDALRAARSLGRLLVKAGIVPDPRASRLTTH